MTDREATPQPAAPQPDDRGPSRKQAPWVPAQQPTAPPAQSQPWGTSQQRAPWTPVQPGTTAAGRPQTLVQPAAPGSPQPGQSFPPQQAPAFGQPAPWGRPPFGSPGGPGTGGAPAGARPTPYGPGQTAAAAHRRRKGPGPVVWAAIGALLAAALVVVAVVFGDDLWNGTPAADTAAPTTGVVEDEPQTDTDTETVPELPQVSETPGPSDQPVPSETAPASSTGDLGLAVPMTAPACDGSWVVFLGAATDAARYAADVETLLAGNPAARYTLTQGGCSSMRQQMPDGTLIYAVWTGPYADQAQACAAKAGFGDTAYVKRMDDTTPPDQLWEC